MEKFQKQGVRTYDQVMKQLRAMDITPSFTTPKHEITILGKVPRFVGSSYEFVNGREMLQMLQMRTLSERTAPYLLSLLARRFHIKSMSLSVG